MKKLLMLSAATLCAGLLLTGCTAFVTKTEVTTEEKVTILEPIQTPEPMGQTEVFDALAGESILGVVIMNPTQEELELAKNVDQVFPDQEYGHSRERELSYLVVHSVLHLLGYDHLDEGEQKAQMRAREDAIMEVVGLTR